MRYFMYKYEIQEKDWSESLNNICRKFNNYNMLSHCNAEVQCDALSSENFVNPETRVVNRYSVANSFSLKNCV